MHRRKLLLGSGVTLTTLVAGCTGSGEEEGNGNSGDDGNGNGDENDGQGDGNGQETDGNGDEQGADDGNGDAESVDEVVGALVEGENVHLVVENVEYATQLGEFTEAEDGNEFVVVSLAMKNVSGDFLSVSNLLQTRVRDDEDYAYDQTYAGGDEPTFNDGQFAPGEVERGAVVFEVPEDASGLELQFDFDVSIFGGIDRAHVDLEESTDVARLEQDLSIDVHDVGSPVAFGDVEVTVNDVRVEGALGEFTEPEEGNEFVVIDMEVTNDTGEEQRISTILQMLVKDGDGYSYQEDLGATTELDRAFDEGTPLQDGETRAGELAYQVEEGSSPLYWVFEFDLWTEGDKTFWQLR